MARMPDVEKVGHIMMPGIAGRGDYPVVTFAHVNHKDFSLWQEKDTNE